MGRRSRLPTFCLSRFTTRIRVREPPAAIEKTALSSKAACTTGYSCNNPFENISDRNADEKVEHDVDGDHGSEKQMATSLGRKVMVVVDSSAEAKFALQWALSDSVQSHDTLVLLDVAKPSKINGDDNKSRKEKDPNCNELLQSMKKISQTKRPEIQVEVCIAEGKDRGPAIVEEARKQGVSVLVLGQNKNSIKWRLLMIWAAGNRVSSSNITTVDYCIQNSSCMTVAVRKHNKRAGGYLITTRKQKDFWLLA